MVEETERGVRQHDVVLVAGVHDCRVVRRAGRAANIADAALKQSKVSRTNEHHNNFQSSSAITKRARSMLSRNGKKASDASATCDNCLAQSARCASVKNAGTSSYIDSN